jgi:hypothetical protein
MLSKYRFFGSETILPGGVSLSRYGEMVFMEPAAANALIAAHPPALVVPEELWDEIFPPGSETDAELAKWPSVTIHATEPAAATNAPAEFLAKTDAVRKAHYEYRESLLAAIVKAAIREPDAAKAAVILNTLAPGPVSEPA